LHSAQEIIQANKILKISSIDDENKSVVVKVEKAGL